MLIIRFFCLFVPMIQNSIMIKLKEMHPIEILKNSKMLVVGLVLCLSQFSAYSFVNKGIDDSLKAHFETKQIEYILQAKLEYDSIKTAADLSNFYIKRLFRLELMVKNAIMSSEPNAFDENNPKTIERWKWFSTLFPCVEVVKPCSTCQIEVATNIVPLVSKSFDTDEEEDDIYIELLRLMYENETNTGEKIYEDINDMANWYSVSVACQDCVYSRLGEGIILNILELIQRYYTIGQSFKERVSLYRTIIMPNDHLTHFSVTKKEVLSEIDKILKVINLTSPEREQIMQLWIKVKGSDVMQFNCKLGKCKWDE